MVSEGFPIHNSPDAEEPESDRRCGIGQQVHLEQDKSCSTSC
jgi:hypothetical protein